MQYRVVNLEKLKSFLAPYIFVRISPEVEKEVEVFSEVHERIKGCVSFCHQIGQKSEGNNMDKSRKYLRAALAEFVSLEDAAEIDCPQGSVSGSLGILSLDDARLHTVRLLRHANVHLSACNIDKTSRPASWRAQMVLWILIIRCSLSQTFANQLSQLGKQKKFSPSDLDEMISWIEKEQMEWGINHLILRSAELYVTEFLRKCT